MGWRWMGSGWWSLAGLILDIAGFSILACDLLPEYRMMTVWRRIEGWRKLMFLADGSSSYARRGAIGGQAATTFAEASKVIRRFIDDGTLKKIDMIANKGSEGWHGVTFPPLTVPEFDGFNHAEWARKVDELAERARSKMAARKRPSIPIAISFIVIGFVLQAWGSIPVDNFVPVVFSVPATTSPGLLGS